MPHKQLTPRRSLAEPILSNLYTDYFANTHIRLSEATDTKRWAGRLHIKYGYGIPASASSHEFTTCIAAPGASGSCVADATGATGYPMIEYTTAAVNAIDRTGALHDPRYLGTAIWDFGDHVSWNGLEFGPVPAPADVLSYLAAHLPGAGNPGLAGNGS